MTAAHRTLPLPCYARVTNLSNGRSVIVRINDRGPFASNRIIDLSYTAAAKLDMIRPGTAFVELRTISTLGSPIPAVPEIDAPAPAASSAAQPGGNATPEVAPAESATPTVGPPSPAEAPAPNAAAPTMPAGTRPVALYVQVGAYSDPLNASKVVRASTGCRHRSCLSEQCAERRQAGATRSCRPDQQRGGIHALIAHLTVIGFPGARLAPE